MESQFRTAFEIISMKLLSVFLFLFYGSAYTQTNSVGIFEHHTDIGNPKNAGSAQYDKSSNTYIIKGSGYNIWFDKDEFQYAYKKLKDDFVLTANFEFAGENGNGHRKIGWMVRESTDDNAAHISAVSHGDGLTVLQWRVNKGDSMRDPEGEIFFPQKKFEVIQLQRIGKTFTMKVGHKGEPLQIVGSHEMPNLSGEVLVGLFVCAHDPEVVQEAKVRDVHINKPQTQ